jgi:hypothetical protein
VVFRAMTPALDGLPMVGRAARLLGVRVPQDIAPDRDGEVRPGTGGMSVAPTSMWDLPNHRRPRGMGRGSTGPSNDQVYSLQEVVLDDQLLALRADPEAPMINAFVEPLTIVALSEYATRLAGTRPSWMRVWPS